MERITRKDYDTGRGELAGEVDMRVWDKILPYSVVSALGKALDRLCAYEETGLDPDDVVNLRQAHYGR